MPEGRNYSSITLSRDETLELIDSEVWLRMASIDGEGRIWNLPTHYVRLGEAVYFDEDPASILIENLRARPNVNAVIDAGYSYDDVKGVILPGKVSIVDDTKLEQEAALELRKKYIRLTGRPPLQDFSQRVFVEFKLPKTPESLSWHYGKRQF